MQVTFHSFSMGDVDDVDIYVAEPIYHWQQTDHGRWVMQHARDLRYYTSTDHNTFGYHVTILGDIDPGPLLTEYFLRWPQKES